ncbi:Protein argonaute [Zalaria obscura]|uniref:Protein argonaute n=1 Tax=Zalaria obscura TaxID=2024903 RepID=A0ACC3SPR2_9PEZI
MAGAQKRRVRREHHDGDKARSHTGSHQSDGKDSSGSASQSASHSGSGSGPSTQQSPGRWDGNRDPAGERDPNASAVTISSKMNIDLGAGAWDMIRNGKSEPNVVTKLPRRPAKASSLGREINMGLNTFHVERLPEKKVVQYDVLIGNGAEARGLIMNLWESRAVQQAIGRGFVFDGNKLAWSLVDHGELRITVDLDAERGRPTKPGGRENKHRVIIKRTNVVKFDQLDSFFSGKANFDNSCLEAVTFLDHLLRQTPSQRYTQIRRNFFAKGLSRFPLGSGVEAFKGVYQSMRIAHKVGGNHGLTVNVDVANGIFWTAAPLQTVIISLLGARNENDIVGKLRPVNGKEARAWTDLKRIRKLRVTAGHRGSPDAYVIDKIISKNAREYTFDVRDNATGQETKMSIFDYFQQKYGQRLAHPDWPLVKMTKGKNTVLPIEVLKLNENQRYNFKTDERQTAQMIKFAVTPPGERWRSVEHGLQMLDWNNDPYLNNYGVKINPNKTVVKARLLQNPKVQFGNGPTDPRTSGRWDLKGKKFLQANNSKPLKAWGVCVIAGGRGPGPNRAVIDKFILEFIKIYRLHGGQVANTSPIVHLASGPDVGKAVEEIWNKAGNQAQARPQILMFVLPDKDSQTYGRIKKSAECRYGVVSQCMQYAHVEKCQAQYISNVCMKFNAKLGGITARAVGPKSGGPAGVFGNIPTLIIGADVSHAAPGMEAASMAAMTVSMDKLATRYAAACNTNGHRVEMITTRNITKLLKPLIQQWVGSVGGGRFPGRIFYFRDGVSEGQYRHVLDQEVADIKALLRTASPKLEIPFVVMVASKRHHFRFFPQVGDSSAADRNGNPLPGTLVETGVTHPFENDFYLCSHSAIKGTARPMHYHMLLNEANISNEELQTMIYEHSYQYIRATTPVSQFPAVYYAHLASNRAIHHDKSFGGGSSERTTSRSQTGSASGGSRSGSQTRGQSPSHGGSSSTELAPTDFPDLMDMPSNDNISASMWYI